MIVGLPVLFLGLLFDAFNIVWSLQALRGDGLRPSAVRGLPLYFYAFAAVIIFESILTAAIAFFGLTVWHWFCAYRIRQSAKV
ncbi:hypothetical protein [Fimbriimonas ginsengisoli]|uniref:Uncharacterized protein n=1 Tax=Fimbriimonas ginsengisoli Gsoil 348 TaxID=661478 RepID=A0A068NS82_FIMGI|nr:hypothetical protein [Fimbriimonas ginsengisoli]AIE85600.1 hypothetical protein OP10G_2232 [Fimbriimonas ginsengisoli Gsoil 348]